MVVCKPRQIVSITLRWAGCNRPSWLKGYLFTVSITLWWAGCNKKRRNMRRNYLVSITLRWENCNNRTAWGKNVQRPILITLRCSGCNIWDSVIQRDEESFQSPYGERDCNLQELWNAPVYMVLITLWWVATTVIGNIHDNPDMLFQSPCGERATTHIGMRMLEPRKFQSPCGEQDCNRHRKHSFWVCRVSITLRWVSCNCECGQFSAT